MRRGRPIPEKVRKEVSYRSGGRCEARLPRCAYWAREIHHVKLRSRMGSNDAKNLLHVCFDCHRLITENKPGTERFRTFSWQVEGQRESDSIGGTDV